jgi:hypothetical protein
MKSLYILKLIENAQNSKLFKKSFVKFKHFKSLKKPTNSKISVLNFTNVVEKVTFLLKVV